MGSGDRYSTRGGSSTTIASSTTLNAALTSAVTDPIYEGLVVDVIVDHMHPEYAKTDGYNAGTIKVRIFSIHNSLDNELLDWAYPMDAIIQELPLKGELVLLHKIRDKFFYMRKVYIAHRIQENGMLNLNNAINNRPSDLRRSITAGSSEIEPERHKFGQYFKPDSRVRPLKHFEGDVIIQGRMGHSIRFGSSQLEPGNKGMAPNIILRTGQAKDAEKKYVTNTSVFGLTLENINDDASSIWMTSDQAVPFEPTTVNAGSFFRAFKKAPQVYDGASIIMNSDKLVLNAKKTHVMLFANEEIYLNSFKNTSIDTDNNIVFSANIDIRNFAGRNVDFNVDEDFIVNTGNDALMLTMKKISFVSNKIYIGSVKGEVEPMVGGTSLSIWLARLITILMGNPPIVATPQLPGLPYAVIPPVAVPGIASTAHVITPMGPGVLNPVIITGLIGLYAELVLPNLGCVTPLPFSGAPFNSIDNFVEISNESPKMEKNEFKEGKQKVTENNKWELSDTSYYKVV